MGKPFSEEIDRLGLTYQWACQQNIVELRRLLSRWTDGPLVIVGSGGSYSAASAWAAFHRVCHGQPAFAATPLSLGNLLRSLKQPRVLLLSAEGRNNDILNAARLARTLDVPCAAVTLTGDNPLTRLARDEKSLYDFAFSMDWGKDGYLATNTLFATVLLAVKTYFESELSAESISALLTQLAAKRSHLMGNNVVAQIHEAGALVLHGPDSELFAIDLESKFAEAALAQCQIADFRQFAHGRHLQLAQDASRVPIAIFAFTSIEEPLARAMMDLFPANMERIELPIFGGHIAHWSISALIEAFLVTEAVGICSGVDPGQPIVPEFGRKIYQQDSGKYLPEKAFPSNIDIAVERKICGAQALEEDRQIVREAAVRYIEKINASRFKALVCDFDGTLCNAHERFSGMNSGLAARLTSLIEDGLCLGIATGRGGSVPENLRILFPQSLWARIWVGPYSASTVKRLDDESEPPLPNPKLYEALEWLKTTVLRQYGICAADKCRAGQVSLRVEDHNIAARIVFALNSWIADNGLIGWRVFSSGHSVDLLDAAASKVNVVERIAKELNIDPISEILRIGDAGQPGGNDFELMRDALSLSVDKVSDSLTCCWNFAPAGVRQAEATNYYLQAMKSDPAGTRITLS